LTTFIFNQTILMKEWTRLCSYRCKVRPVCNIRESSRQCRSDQLDDINDAAFNDRASDRLLHMGEVDPETIAARLSAA